MNKDDRHKLQCILMINAIVKFNLFPPKDSEEWNENLLDYEMMDKCFMPEPNPDFIVRNNILDQLHASATTKTISAKLNIYTELTKLTGFTLLELSGPILSKLDLNTLTGQCSYILFKNPEQNINAKPHLTEIIQAWAEYYNSPEYYYLWDDRTFVPPWTANKIAAAFCLELKKTDSNDISLSCLYGLANALDRKDIISILDEYKITTENLPAEALAIYEEFLSNRQIDPINTLDNIGANQPNI